ncbi:hypothetical protein N7495_003553 [Penicillium taxi]|uniref:uncharacterized protein n=1 Tax=Penicillium taxi TaxID=168475 RepID=UPI0025451658|nr:uncharacterized protein N7495_003553 [Penicillium taxi]KAJ5898809.1 hypothetical protein N7495_003553 [Penicillium taxi]
MGKPPFSESNTIGQPAKRRRVGSPNVAGSSQSSRPGLVDSNLIEGSRQERRPTVFPHESLSIDNPGPSVGDEDTELDAFDLELLAQGSKQKNPYQEEGVVRYTPRHASLFRNSEYQAAPQVTSRFFDPSSSLTPLRGQASSQVESRFGSPPSPLALLNERKQGILQKPTQLGSPFTPHQPDSNQSSQQLPSSSKVVPASHNRGQHQPFSPFNQIPPSIRGIVLVSVNELPYKYRSLFSFPLFNAIQSKCFLSVYNTNNNLVLSAPTGSGKTVIMELAVCRLLNTLKDERFKVVYQAPTKSLCAERFRDWNSKFAALNLKCAELTGDTDYTHLRNVQSSQIIITTPEKWDSMTRKWKDHMRLMQLVKLFLVDEVHILKESRGATLEAVVSRMKTIGSNVRFVALSATIPNSEDIATWLGKDATNQHVPAHREHFGEDFRPVKLQKFVYGYQSNVNDFAFDKVLSSKLLDHVAAHSCKKPIMIFCCTRNSTVATAKILANSWSMTNPPSRVWKGPGRPIEVHNEDLNTTIPSGVAFHHAGLSIGDRNAVEKGFRDGHINVICCTSTLAVGVNLPCHLVIIKNTVGWQEGQCKEYSDLEMMQMLGRAGRPQFDDSAVAVILTKRERVSRYEKLVSGSESLESCLHLNLIDHLNAEIGLGHITNLESATKWLAGTFLFVRLRRNPSYYQLKEEASEDDEDELLRQICEKDITLLQECGLVTIEKLGSTQFGDAMARYCVRFETMRILMSLRLGASIHEILYLIVQADDFQEVRLRAGEKSLYREINRDPGIRYPIMVDVTLSAHKVSLLLQSELAAIEFPGGDQFQKHKFSMQQDRNFVFTHVNRLIRCIIDCQISREDSTSIRNALELARSLSSRVWDHSPLQMKQIEQIGVVAVRKLAAAGITGIDDLGLTEAHNIEMILSRHPPFGTKLLARLKDFPNLRITAKMVGQEAKPNVKIHFELEVAFMNNTVPSHFQRKPIYVCCLTETSDGRMIDFRRISASKLQKGLEVTLIAELTSSDQQIVCHVMCDEIAGTSRQAIIKPDMPSYLFSAQNKAANKTDTQRLNPSKARDDFDGDDLELDDFITENQRLEQPKESTSMKSLHFDDDIEWLSIEDTPSPPRHSRETTQREKDQWKENMEQYDHDDCEESEAIKLPNGNWACHHRCKDRKNCKHLCCKEGLEKPPKPSKKRTVLANKTSGLNQLTLSDAIPNKEKPGSSRKESQKAATKRKPTDKAQAIGVVGGKLSAKKTGKSTKRELSTGSIENSSARSPSDTVSSNYGDELGDLQFLFEDAGLCLANSGPVLAPATEKTISLSKGFITPPIPRIMFQECMELKNNTVKAGPSNWSERSLPVPTQTESMDIWDDTPTGDSGRDGIFTDANTLGSSATTAHFTSEGFPRTPKRKARVLDLIENKASQKRAERCTSMDYENPKLQDTMTVDPAALELVHSPTDPDNASMEWDDVDRMMMEEFNDIINFY